MILQHDPLQDRPIRDDAADGLNRGPFVDSFVRVLVRDEIDATGNLITRRSTGFVVGLTGLWGLGKSSVMNLLALKLGSMDRVLVAQFNPWLLGGSDELLSGFFNSLRNVVGTTNGEDIQQLRESVDRYWAAIDFAGHAFAATADVAGGGGAFSAGWTAWKARVRKLMRTEPVRPDDARAALEKKIAQSGCAVVVLIDELDRVEDEEVRAVARLIKAVGDIKGISYVVAYDPARVADALGRGDGDTRRQTGERYLEKIIQHPIPLRPLFSDDTRALLLAALDEHSIKLSPEVSDGEKKIFEYLVEVIETPREVKRLIGTFSVLERAVRGEVSAYDVLGYSWILTKSPGVRDKIASHFNEIVDDPTEAEMINRVTGRLANAAAPDPTVLLGAQASAQRRMLELLFPRFSTGDESGASNRISKRANLVRVLFMGDPPGMIPRREIERLWAETDAAKLEMHFRKLVPDGRLAALVDRVDDLLDTLPEGEGGPFWVALARSLVRQKDWLEGPESSRAVADDVATALYRLVLRNPAKKPYFRHVLGMLIAENDLVIAPWILRKLLYAHGLSKHSSGDRSSGILTKEETLALMETELPRYKKAVLDGFALRRLPNMEAIFSLANVNRWDDELRHSLTGQLSTIDAISTFAALLVPPGYLADLSGIEELCDAGMLKSRLEALTRPDTELANPWMAASLSRLRRILGGKDSATFDDEGVDL